CSRRSPPTFRPFLSGLMSGFLLPPPNRCLASPKKGSPRQDTENKGKENRSPTSSRPTLEHTASKRRKTVFLPMPSPAKAVLPPSVSKTGKHPQGKAKSPKASAPRKN